MRGPLKMTSSCPRCGGSGTIKEPCAACAGQGFVMGEQPVRVRIPAGADDGDELRVRGKGSPGLFGGAAGDLLIRTRVTPHPWFERTGLDLRIKLPITLVEAVRGASVAVPTPSGVVQMKLKPRTQQGTQLRLKGKGVQRGETRGDLYVVVDVRLPDSEDPAMAELIAQVAPFYSRDVREGVAL
jgi:molecular chaperone DnaJ